MPIIQRIEVRCDLMGFWLFYFMENEVEIWKDVVGFEGFYKVSNLGNVYSCFMKKNLKTSNSNRYRQTTLCNGKVRKQSMVHQLVAMAFIDKDYKKKNLVCNHIDRVRSNNKLSNLEIITQRGNSSYDRDNGLKVGVTHRRGKYIARVFYKNKFYHLGSYDTIEEAHLKYKEAFDSIENEKFNYESIRQKSITYSGFKNIGFDTRRGHWFVRITFNKKRIFSRAFLNIEDAKLELSKMLSERKELINNITKSYLNK